MNDSISAPNSINFVVSDFKNIASQLAGLMGELNKERGNLMMASAGSWVDGFAAADAQWKKVLDLVSGSTTVMATKADDYQMGIRQVDKMGENAFRSV